MDGKEWQAKALQRLTELGLIIDNNGTKLVDLERFKPGSAVLRKKAAFCGIRLL